MAKVNWKCKHCEQRFSGGTVLGQHYKDNPECNAARGKVYKQKKRPSNQKSSRQSVQVCFCPQCGLNLKALATAMQVTAKFKLG